MNRQLANKVDIAISSIEDLVSEVNNLESALEDADNKISILEQKVEVLKNDLDESEERNTDRKILIDTYTAQIDNLMRENDLLQEQLNNIE